jgi:hypothetical protein
MLNSFLIQAQEVENKKVLIAILARNKEHVLPLYLNCIENLDYKKKLITIYINTNNNCDHTQQVLQEWIKKNENQYQKIIFENHEISQTLTTLPHEWWNVGRCKILGMIRQASLQKAQEEKSDFYFVVDCDNFITPCTLKELIKKDKSIIAPMLRAIGSTGDRYSNFFAALGEDGGYVAHPKFDKIRDREWIGTFQVPVVHCTYLIKSEYFNKLSYVDGSDFFEFLIFSKSARNNHIDQYICNEKNFGVLLHFFDDKLTLEEEVKRVKSKEFQDLLLGELNRSL